MAINIAVTGFDHYVLNCADVEQSLNFYVEVLGLQPVRVEEWQAGDAPFPSARVCATTIIDFFPSAPDGRNVDHVCLTVANEDLDAIEAAFPGCRRADGLFGAQGYASSVYLSDPDGNTVELRHYERAEE